MKTIRNWRGGGGGGGDWVGCSKQRELMKSLG